ncbi:MAG: ABC transporter substrate-binding protein [Elioraea sp.]|nr:ABC transporter substrate-binding protein [Elioraea sp.]MDW8255253.1 ABC transporter substrate-binding protein [Chloroflexota bacterium]
MKRTVTVGVEALPANFDMEQPAGFRNDLGADLFQNLYDQLTSPRGVVGEDGVRRVDWRTLRADLAEAWWWSDDRRTCVFRLRDGVRSAAGNPLTAEDVRWGWQRAFALRDIGKWVARVASVRDEEAIEVRDRLTIAFHLEAPNPALPAAMAQCTPSVYDTAAVLPHCTASDPWAKAYLAEHPAGFGPYTLAGRAEDEIVLRAAEGYWRGPAAIAEARLRRFRERGETIEALRRGEVDLVLGLTLDEAAALRAEPTLRIAPADTPPGVALHLDVSAPPFDNLLVRRAVAHAIPYQEIIATAYLGVVRRWKSWLQPENPGYAPEEWPFEENIARARQLMEEAGVGPIRTTLAAHAGDGAAVAAQIIADGLARIGIEVTIEAGQARGRPDLVGMAKANLAPLMLRAGAGRGHRVYDPIYTLMHDFGPGRMRLVRYAYDNPALFDALRAIAEAGERWEDAVRQAQAILNADAAVIPICWSRFYVAHHRDLTGYRWYPDNRLRFFDLQWR